MTLRMTCTVRTGDFAQRATAFFVIFAYDIRNRIYGIIKRKDVIDMYNVGDTVLYGTDGVCTVKEIAVRSFGKEKAEYIVLTPLHQNGAVIYVPTASEALLAKMRRVLSEQEIHALIRGIAEEECTDWIADENARRAHFKNVLVSGDRRELIRMIKTVYWHGKVQKANGRKLHHSDEAMMKDAEKLLYDEFAYVLGIKPDEVLGFITNTIEQ